MQLGLIDLISSTAFLVCSTFFSNGIEEPSKMISSKPARAATSAFSSEWVWSALRKIGYWDSSRKALISAVTSRTPKNSRSPSDTPIITGNFKSCAALTMAFIATNSETLKCPTAILSRCALVRTSRNVSMMSPRTGAKLRCHLYRGGRISVSGDGYELASTHYDVSYANCAARGRIFLRKVLRHALQSCYIDRRSCWFALLFQSCSYRLILRSHLPQQQHSVAKDN